MIRSRPIMVLLSIGSFISIYWMGFYEYRQKQTTKAQILLNTNHTATSVTAQILMNNAKPQPVSNQGIDFPSLARDLREYSSTHSTILEEKLFPWWFHRRTDSNAKQQFSGKAASQGIIICTGNAHFHLTLVALSALKLIGNELPVEVVYSSSTDLSATNRQELKNAFPTVQLTDISSTSINDSSLELRGWEIKPFAVLASQFQHVLLMDADVLFLEKPSVLFLNPYYLKTGSLFFYDRPSLGQETIRWIRTLSADNDKQSIPQRTQESGVVLIDKARVLTGLLATCKLNGHQEREQVTYRHLHGDKDTWWLGFHLIQMPYSFIPTMTAAIGQVERNSKICGHILHLDENHRPIWWNGGMFRNRYANTQQLLNIEGWLYEGQWQLMTYSCLTNTGQTTQHFNEHQKQLISGYRTITKKEVQYRMI